MQKYIVLILFFWLEFSLMSQRLIPYRKGPLWGYADSSGTIVIEPKFDYASMDECGILCVKLNGLFGVIDRSGKIIIPISYPSVFYNCPPKYSPLLFTQNNNGFFIFNKDGKLVQKVDRIDNRHKSKNIVVTVRNRQGLIAPSGRWLARPSYFREVRVTEGGGFVKTGLFWTRYYNEDGQFKFRTLYRGSFDFYGKYANVFKKRTKYIVFINALFRKYYDERGKRVSFIRKTSRMYVNIIDIDGKLLLPRKYTHLSMPLSGYVIGYNNRDYTLFDSLGHLLYNHGHTIECDRNLTCYSQDALGKYLSFASGSMIEIPSDYPPKFNGKVYLVHSDNKSNLVDLYGKKLFEQDFDYIISSYDDSTFCAKRNDKLYWINEHGHLVLESDTNKYTKGFPFKNGQAIVSKNGFYGMIDQDGQLIIPLKYYGLQRLMPDAYIIGTRPDPFNQANGLMRLSGELLLDTVYTSIYLSNQKTHIIAANKERLMGLYDLTGNSLLPCIYSNIAQWPDKFFTLQMRNPNYNYSENNNTYPIIGFQADPDGKNLIRLPGNSGQKGYFLYDHIEKGWFRFDGTKFYED
jgi:hypothetical protein